MKKILTILLVAVLAVGFAFAADFTGNATISAGYNLDNTDWGFANATALTAGNITLKLGGADVGSTGEGDIYAEIAGTYAINLLVATTTGATPVTIVPTLNSTFEITDANIHFGEDLVVGILNAGGGYSYAVSYWDDNDDGDADVEAVALGSKMAPGFTVTYKDYTAGFGMNGNAKAKTYKFFGQAQTPSYTLAEGVTLQAAAYGYLANDDKAAGAAVKGAYAGDAFTANLGVDFVYDGGAKVEAALKAAYAPVTLDVYFTNQDVSNLSAKVAVEMGNITASVDARSLLNVESLAAAAQPRKVSVAVKGVFDAIEAQVTFGSTFAAKTYAFGGYVKYSAEKFAVKGGADLTLNAAADPAKLTAIKPYVQITSTALVNNATLTLAWAGADFADANADGKVNALGAITASCEIAF
ncbi:MAG: hypothetical protein PHO44_08335 [Sphaerochaetaceae bacterium]|nr:hypothetical protein [Sphaerochaetaceae bacterium]